MSIMEHVPNALSSRVGRAGLHLQHQSPNLLFAAGVVGVVATAVLAGRATLRLESTLNGLEETRDAIRNGVGKELKNGKTYDENDQRRDMIVHNTRSAVEIVKLYAPTIAVGAVSIGCLTGAHVVLNRRNVALTAAYAGLERAYNGYRDRVREQYGEESELALHHGTVTREVANPAPGAPRKEVIVDGTRSMYARFFDECSKSWNPQPEYNLVFLRCQQNYANDLLKSRGHLFLNEVYDMLGLERTRAGSVVGWLMDGKGDSFVDFGMYEDRPQTRLFINGQEPSILLDFNVDGVIYDKI